MSCIEKMERPARVGDTGEPFSCSGLAVILV